MNDIIARLDALDARWTARFDAMDARWTTRFDAMDARWTTRFDAMDARFDAVDARFDAVDARFNAVDARLDGMDARFDAVDARFNAVDARLDGMDARFDAVDARFVAVDARFDRLMAAVADHFEVIGMQLLRLEERTGRLEERIGALEKRMTTVECALEVLKQDVGLVRVEIIERWIGVDERFTTLTMGLKQFEGRVGNDLKSMDQRLQQLQTGVDRLANQAAVLDAHWMITNQRFDSISEDMRQRFRVLIERVVSIDRRLVA